MLRRGAPAEGRHGEAFECDGQKVLRRHPSLEMPEQNASWLSRNVFVYFTLYFTWTLHTFKLVHHCMDARELRDRLRAAHTLEGMVSALLFTIVAELCTTEPLTNTGDMPDDWLLQRFDHGNDVFRVNLIFFVLCTTSLILNIFHLFVLLTSLSPLFEATPDTLLTAAVHKYVDGPGKIMNLVFSNLVFCVVVAITLRFYMSCGKVVVFAFILTLIVLNPLYMFWAIRTWPLFAPTTAAQLGICTLNQDVCERAAWIIGAQEYSAVHEYHGKSEHRSTYKKVDLTSDFERLASLHKEGMLSDAEFAAAKRCILENAGAVLSS